MSLSRSYSRHSKTLSSSSHSSLSSFSSSSSSASWNCDSPINPITPMESQGVPFLWEHSPGIRKKSHFPQNYKGPSPDLLPLPPAARSAPATEFKKLRYNYVGRDPFITALVKCSKKDLHPKSQLDDYWKITKPPRAVNDLVGTVDRYKGIKSCKSHVDDYWKITKAPRAVNDLVGTVDRYKGIKSSKSPVDDYWKITKASRAVNDLVGTVDRYTSCKTTCSVVDSTVFIPRSGRPVFDFSNRRSRLG